MPMLLPLKFLYFLIFKCNLTAGFFIKAGIEGIEVLGIQPFLRQPESFTKTLEMHDFTRP